VFCPPVLGSPCVSRRSSDGACWSSIIIQQTIPEIKTDEDGAADDECDFRQLEATTSALGSKQASLESSYFADGFGTERRFSATSMGKAMALRIPSAESDDGHNASDVSSGGGGGVSGCRDGVAAGERNVLRPGANRGAAWRHESGAVCESDVKITTTSV
jgi:hypothetical protein